MSQGNKGASQGEERLGWSEVSGGIEIDPVCGMEVDRETAAGGSIHYDGTRYYFCSDECKMSFDGSPEEYVGVHEGINP